MLALCAGLTAGVNAATPYYSVNDYNAKLAPLGNANGDAAGGIGSTAAGIGTSVKTSSQLQGATATAVGMLNTIDASTGGMFDGVANAVVGAANTTQNANATLIFGAGNLVTNSYGAVMINPETINPTDPVGLSKTLAGAVKDSGGQILVVGGANVVDHARFSSITGVSNNLTGTTDKDSEYNFISGAKNTVTGSDHAYVIGTDNEVTNSTGNTLIGDNRTLTGVTNSVILGSGLNSDTKLGAKDVSNVVVAGYKANATVAGGVAIGSDSIANVEAGKIGTAPTNTTVSDDDKKSATWTSTLGAVSVGYAEYKDENGTTVPAGTRQITNVAAGTQDTDAVNLAQLNKVASLINTSNTDNGVKYVSINSDADGNKDNLGASVNNSMAIGPNASTAAVDSLVIGSSTIKNTGTFSKVIGNGNTLSSTDAFTAEDSKVFGDNNTITNSNRQLVFGDNNIVSGRDQGTISPEKRITVSDVIIGKGNNITGNETYWSGNESLTVIGNNNIGKNPASGIVIGNNQSLDVISASVVIGSLKESIKNQDWYGGGSNVVIGHQAISKSSGNVLLGNSTVAGGGFQTIAGADTKTGYSEDGKSGLLTAVYGAFNNIEHGYEFDSEDMDATASSIVGSLNHTNRARGTVIVGAGNEVLNSNGEGDASSQTMEITGLMQFGSEYILEIGDTDHKSLLEKELNLLKYTGGASVVLGSANKSDYANRSQIFGNGNILEGKDSIISSYNTISGYSNIGNNISRTAIIGSGNTISNTTDNIVLGDYHEKSGGEHNVILGSQKYTETAKKIKNNSWFGEIEYDVVMHTPQKPHAKDISNAVMLGYNTDVSINGGVALGSESIAATDSSVQGYNPIAVESTTTALTARAAADASSDASALGTPTWTSTLGAVSVGYAADGDTPAGTRQITNVAAGTEDTDAVNVAQLKAAKVTVTGGTNIASVESTATLDGGTVYTVNAKDIYVTSATLSDGTLTINQNEGSPIRVTGLATTSDVENSKVHYYSTKSDKKADGSNFANDGAKANDSIVIGINSSNSQDAVNSIVLGNGTTLEGSKNGTNGKVNSSVVVANGATINGIYNSVLATDYNNSPSGVATPTTVKGQHNTVIGAGNTVSGDQGVTIGTLNNVIAAYAIGQNNTVKSKGLAFGSNNTVGQTSEDGGIAIGRNLTVEGYEGVAIGGETQALADYSIAIGSGIRASEPSTVVEKAATQGIALGYGAKAKVSGGIALGAGSQATTAAKVKGYDPSTDAQSTNTTGVWQSGKGALSIGTPNNTRQITGVAAGWQDTDAVNVAQLKAAKVSLVGGDNIASISTAFTPENGTTYTINAVDTDTTITKGEVTYNGSAGKLVLTDSNDKTLEITGLRDLDTTGVTLNGDTLTFTRNDGTTYTVGGLATATDLAANKIHYYSVNGPATPGGNYNNDGAKGDNALAAGVGASAVAHNSIAIGNKAWIIDSNGGKGSGDIAIGNGAKVENYADQSAGISLGQNAYVENMAGKQEAIFALGQTTFSGNFLSKARIPADPSKVAAGISIGENSYARSGSLMVGTHKYIGKLGDVDIDTSTEETRRKAGVGVNNTTIGTNSFNGGTFSTITGAYSITTTNYAGGRNSIDAGKNFGSTIMGSLNSIESATAENSSSGVANSVVGFANKTANANGSLIFGAGNEITNSVTTISIPGTGLLDSSSAADSAKELQDKMKALVQRSNSGGATLAIGGGNKADYTRASSIIGVNNTLTGTANDISEYNSIMGYKNTAENVSNVTVAGINNKISNTTSAVVLGDNHKVTGANNSIVIGSADKETELTATDAVVIGRNANVEKVGGVALGSDSIANIDKGVLGYIPTGKTLTDADKKSPTWTSTLGAVSVGDVANGKTRQITGVAAGKEATDAVNVAQLQAVAAIAENAGTAAGKHTVVSVNGGDTATNTTYVGDGNLQINVTSKDGQNRYDIKLSDKLTIGTKGEPGKDGQPGTKGKAGSITIIGENGKDDKGNELPEGNNTSANISVKDGAKGLDGKDGVTRIVYLDETGKVTHEVATMDDGLNFAGDDAKPIPKKLNEQLDIKGGADTEKLSDNNIGVVSETKDGKTYLSVKLAKDLTGLTSINVGGTKGVDGNYIGGITINTGGINMGDTQITNVRSGATGEDENGKPVYNNNKNVANIGDVIALVGKEVEAAKVTAGDNISVENNKVSLKEDITLGKDEANQVAIKGSDGTITAGSGANQVALDGKNGQVTIGNAGDQIIMGNQEVSPIKPDGSSLGTKENGQFITGLDNTTWNPNSNGYVPDRAATEGQLKDIADKINNIDTAVKDSSRVFAGDDGAKVTVKNGDTLHLNGGADAANLSDGNIGVVAHLDEQGNTKDILDIKLSKNLTGLESVTTENLTVNKGANIGDVSIAGDTITVGKGDSQTIINDNSVKTGNTTINNDGLTVKGPEASKDITIQNNNVNMGGNVIHNIGDGVEPGDAINKGQFDKTINDIGNGMNHMSNRISKLDRRVDRVGAGAAALAALHPLEFSPEAKWEVSAGVGNYKGANAVAIGAFYRPNGDTMFSIGTSLGGGENMVNAGVTLRVGDGETENYPARKVMAQQIKDLQSVVNTQNEKIEQLTQLVNTLVGANQQIQPVVSAPQAQADAEEAQQA
ncbi:YadA-like family protein [Veillonella sp. R32]|uniref:YadA-like family protein n=1 Tax=Veillonella sp. R32 TaxID=2021312 RepID=UPI00272BC4CA|nr:YadA-like family protein [Veillonella sp. R32]